MRGGIRRHPNILAYVDSWEQDEALFIQTELCELGNFAHFLWEYGRAFPKLEEARVWKILADLSNVSLPLGSCRCLVFSVLRVFLIEVRVRLFSGSTLYSRRRRHPPRLEACKHLRHRRRPFQDW